MPESMPEELLAAIARVNGKRPRTVLQHILEHGSITTDELKSLYGYEHPPRAARDVKENGIPLLMSRVAGPGGRSIAQYTIDVDGFLARVSGTKRGRRPIPRAIKVDLVERFGVRCEACQAEFEADRLVQVDHRVPFEIAGDPSLDNPDEFMLLCPSCNREKSWTCEHCPNWTQQVEDWCQTCYWANPFEYSHLATVPLRIVRLAFVEDEIRAVYAQLVSEAADAHVTVQDLIKRILAARS